MKNRYKILLVTIPIVVIVSSGYLNAFLNFVVNQNNIQFSNDDSKHTRYFLLNGILYETSFVIC